MDKKDELILKLHEELILKEQKINELTAESTEWEERTYYWQDRAEELQDKIYNIQQEIEMLNQCDYNDHNLMVVLNHIEEIVNGK